MEGHLLSDLGERRIVRELLARRYAQSTVSFGDDAAVLGVGSERTIVATTDPAPRPAAWAVLDEDYYDWGWLLAAINLSDLAAAGAEPLGVLTSLTLPLATPVERFERLLDGIDACCKTVGTAVRGGNIKESTNEVCEGTAIGAVPEGLPFSRLGGAPGDAVFVFGSSGLFWTGMLALQRRVAVSEPEAEQIRDALVRPRPLVSLGRALRRSGLVHSCTDASDGLYAAMAALTVEHGLGLTIDSGSIEVLPLVERVAKELELNPLRLLLGFGNMELVCCARPESEPLLRDIARRERVAVTSLGLVDDTGGINLRMGKLVAKMGSFDNERFTPASQFTAGLAAYEQHLLSAPLWDG